MGAPQLLLLVLPPHLECRQQRRLVDDAAPRRIDDEYALAALGERGRVDDVARGGVERRVQRHEVRGAPELVQRHLADASGGRGGL